MTYTEKIKKSIHDNGLFQKGDKVIVAVSGGADSTFLLYFLYLLQNELGLSLAVAHFNHRFRKDSDKDETFVQKLAAKLNLPCYVKSATSALKNSNGSLEEKAREARFHFLRTTGLKVKASSIALGHTRDDLAETVLMRILRGAGLYGLRGILPARNIDGFRFVRPLLDISHEEILRFMKKEKHDFCRDSTNNDTVFFRNRIRRKLLPTLEQHYNADVKHVLANLSQVLSADYDFIHKVSQHFIQRNVRWTKTAAVVNLSSFNRCHLSLQRLVVRLIIEKLKGNLRSLTFRHIRVIETFIADSKPEKTLHLSPGLSITKDTKRLRFHVRSP